MEDRRELGPIFIRLVVGALHERALESARSFEFRPGVEAASAGLAKLKGAKR